MINNVHIIPETPPWLTRQIPNTKFHVFKFLILVTNNISHNFVRNNNTTGTDSEINDISTHTNGLFIGKRYKMGGGGGGFGTC